jgi:hypothetical protein
MKAAIDDIALEFEQLTERVRALENRVAALEGRPVQPAVASLPATFPPLERSKAPATWRGFPPAEMPAGMVPVIGKAVLGIAGAYLLRAIAESGVVPRVPIVVLAVVYAGLWLAWAVRKYVSHRLAGVTYAVTSALIVCPLMWESTVRFHVLEPSIAAVVLVGFVLASVALCWRREVEIIPFVVTLATAVTCLALIAGAGDFVPFSGALLAMALLAELAACSDRQRLMRTVPAIAADLALSLLLLVVVSPQGIGEGMHAASSASVMILCLGLLATYGGSIGFRGFFRLCRLTVFETVQACLAFSIGAGAVLLLGRGTGSALLGGFFLILSAVCYWGALSRFAGESYTRNRRISASWAAALLIAGAFLVFPGNIAIVFLCLSAVCASYLYSRSGKFSLGFHATLFLGAALAVSPLASYVVRALALTVPGSPSWVVWCIVIAAAACYGVGATRVEEKRRRRVLWVVPALVLGFTVAAVATTLIVSLGGRIASTASALSVIRTAVNCILAVVLGFLCLRQQRIELGWVAYMAVGFGTLKLLFEDLRFGDAWSLVVSFLFYGSVLILLPRLTRKTEA